MNMEKGSFHSIGRLKSPSSLLRYSQINGFAVSLQQKVRVRLPKLLLVKNSMGNTEKGVNGKRKKIKWTKAAGLPPKEIGSLFGNASRKKKPPLQRDTSSSRNDGRDDAYALDECMEERDQLIASGKKVSSVFKTWMEDSVERLTLSKSCSFKKIPENFQDSPNSGSERRLDFASPTGRTTKQILEQNLKVQMMMLLLIQRTTSTGHQSRSGPLVTASLEE